MQQHDIPELTPDEELDRTRVLPDPVDPLEGSARLPELRPEDEPGPEDEPEVPQKPKRRGRVVRKIVKYFLFHSSCLFLCHVAKRLVCRGFIVVGIVVMVHSVTSNG